MFLVARFGHVRHAEVGRVADRGQAALESLIAVPAFLLIVLGAMQLALVQHARLMVGYAAFQSARAGVVWNGQPQRMRDAALLALLPAFGRSDSLERLDEGRRRVEALENALGKKVVDVRVVEPTSWSDAEAAGQGGSPDELDFDGPGEPGRERRTVLVVDAHLLFELKIPLANAAIFWAWVALRKQGGAGAGEVQWLQALAGGHGKGSQYFLPLTGRCRMRMQSNPYRKWAAPPAAASGS